MKINGKKMNESILLTVGYNIIYIRRKFVDVYIMNAKKKVNDAEKIIYI